jgi:uncharacterized protein YjcR
MTDSPLSTAHETASPDSDLRTAARALYWQGWRISSIARHLGVKRSTVESWRRRERWSDTSAVARVESSLEARLMTLIAKT